MRRRLTLRDGRLHPRVLVECLRGEVQILPENPEGVLLRKRRRVRLRVPAVQLPLTLAGVESRVGAGSRHRRGEVASPPLGGRFWSGPRQLYAHMATGLGPPTYPW